MKVLVDTNVVLDVLLKRPDFYKDSFAIFQLIDRGYVSGVLSAASITDIFYLLRKKLRSLAETYPIMDELASLFSIIPVAETTIASALALRWKDFEDAVQFVAAKENNIVCILTRNESDYESADIPCINPTDFIAKHALNKE